MHCTVFLGAGLLAEGSAPVLFQAPALFADLTREPTTTIWGSAARPCVLARSRHRHAPGWRARSWALLSSAALRIRSSTRSSSARLAGSRPRYSRTARRIRSSDGVLSFMVMVAFFGSLDRRCCSALQGRLPDPGRALLACRGRGDVDRVQLFGAELDRDEVSPLGGSGHGSDHRIGRSAPQESGFPGTPSPGCCPTRTRPFKAWRRPDAARSTRS